MAHGLLGDPAQIRNSLTLFGQNIRADTPYFAMFGRFIAEYALAEAAVHMVARHLVGLSNDAARAIFSGLRLNDIQNRIFALMDLTKFPQDKKKIVEDCFSQLDAIGFHRDRLVHRSLNFDQDRRVLSADNVFTAKSVSKTELHTYTLGDLDDMRDDAGKIFYRLSQITHPQETSQNDSVIAWVNSPWRYKPPEPPPRPKSPRKARKALRRQRGASQP